MKIGKRIIATAIAIVMIISLFASTAFAASWSSDWKYWSQKQSGYSWVKSYGCLIVAVSKMFVQAGIENPSSFNPDTFYNWHVNKYGSGQLNWSAPSAYASAKGKSLTRVSDSISESQVYSYLSQEYHMIAAVQSSYGWHWVLIDKDKTKANNALYCFDSDYDNATGGNYPIKLRSRYSTIHKIVLFKGYSGSSTTKTYTYSSISSGIYSFKNMSNGYYMNLAYGADEDKKNIHGHDTYYNSSCRYSISKGTYGYEIKPTASSTRLVNAWGSNPSSGSNVNIYPDQGNDKTQQWLFESVSGGYIIHLASNPNLVLTQTSSNSYNIEVGTRTGASNQIWILENATAYTIKFDANGGTGAPASQTKIHNRNLTISPTKPTRSGYVFKGWSTTSTNQTLCVVAGGTFYANGNYTLYAMWEEGIDTPNNITIDDTNFPDENFRNFISEEIDTDSNGKLSATEISNTTEIDVRGMGISSLKGVEYFTSLTNLYCSVNNLSILDVSKNTKLTNLYCSNNNLSTLDVSKNTKLLYFDCSCNNLTELDVSKNTELYYFYCDINSLSTLDVSKNTDLYYFDCSCNNLTELDVSKNTDLYYFYCYNNNLSTLDVSKNTKLVWLYCSSNNLSTLDVSKNTSLGLLDCANINLSTLDISNNKNLATLYCSNNNLSTLDISENTALSTLHCYNNNLSTLDVSDKAELTSLLCSNNNLSTLDVSKNTKLYYFECDNNNLSTLDVSKNTDLHTLRCNNNNLSTLDVSKNTELIWLYCNDNNLSTLDVSKNTKLNYFDCGNNNLSTLDLSKNTSLVLLGCAKNNLSTLDVSNNKNLENLCCFNNNLSILDVSKNTKLTNLYCDDNNLSTLDLSKNTELYELECGNNNLSTLDVSKNTDLHTLRCNNNNLSTLDVSNNTKLNYFDCGNNNLSTLDVSKNMRLIDLTCSNNNLSTLDVSGNRELDFLACHHNYIRSLDTSKNIDLYYLVWQPQKICNTPSVKMTRVSGKTSSGTTYTGKPKLSWSAIENAVKYEVYRSTSKTGTYSLLGTTTGTSYTNSGASAGVTNYYKVKAIGETGYLDSDFSTPIAFTCTLSTPSVTMSRVSGTTSSGTKYTGKPKLTWKAVTGASKYEIYRATSKTGTYSKIATTTSTSYINSGASAGKTYYYKVKAISKDSTYANSAYSSIKTFTCTCSTPSVSIALSSNKPKLTWKAITGASKYEVYRATSKSGSYSKIATTTSLSYRDSKATSGKTYYYKVKAISKDSTYANSAYSSIKSIKSK